MEKLVLYFMIRLIPNFLVESLSVMRGWLFLIIARQIILRLRMLDEVLLGLRRLLALCRGVRILGSVVQFERLRRLRHLLTHRSQPRIIIPLVQRRM
jgi:hypothetical protein